MIDPKVLEEFEKQLAELVGQILYSVHALRDSQASIPTQLVYFGRKDSEKLASRLHIECGWQILHSNSVVFTYAPDVTIRDEALLQLQYFKGHTVQNVYFNINDLSMTIHFSNFYALKLLHSEDDNWRYHLLLFGGYGFFYEIYNNTIGEGTID